MAQWWEHSPPTNVARVQIPASTPKVGWGCCWFSPLPREVFLRVLRFSPLLKNQPTNSIWNVRTSLNEFIRTPKCFGVNKIISIYIFFYNRTSWSKFVVGRSVAWRDKKRLLRRLSNSMPYLKTLNGLAKPNWIDNKTWNQINVTVGINRIFELGGTFLT